MAHRDAGKEVVDLRPSRAFNQAHISAAKWQNISAFLAGDAGQPGAAAIVGTTHTHCRLSADLLQSAGWAIEGVHIWTPQAFDPSNLATGEVTDPIDECALFAGRHSGNMQDSRDYLAWEEELPGQIDKSIRGLWQTALDTVFKQ